MPKPNGLSKKTPAFPPPAMTSLAVSGFKSIVNEQTLEIRPLTLLAGANSSGKSSMLQPLLLLKQTLEAPYDPGPLLLNGPNVKFTSTRQFFPTVSGRGHPTEFVIAIETSNESRFAAAFHGKVLGKSFDVNYNHFELKNKKIRVDRKLTYDSLVEFAHPQVSPTSIEEMRNEVRKFGFEIKRDRFGFDIGSVQLPMLFLYLFDLIQLKEAIARLILDVVHLPGLRGNPERTYPVTTVGPRFPGTFENYVASLIDHWSTEASEKLSELSDGLKMLGLSWKVEAKRVDETQVELRVGRILQPKQGGARDLINIADVGVGVSQALPVAVALIGTAPGQLVYIEQPEIHLHPRAQVAMARLLVNAAKRGVRVVAETHSSLLLLGVQALVAEAVIEPSEVGLNWFLRDTKSGITRIQTAELDEAGRFGDWPEDFDEVALEAENRYLSAAERRLAKR